MSDENISVGAGAPPIDPDRPSPDATDIVERLRAEAPFHQCGGDSDGHPDAGELMLDAANKIERLRSPWQPIDTVPKDGTAILLYFPGGYWASGDGIAIGFWNGDWYDNEAASKSMTAFGEQPTHWMPLPAPPKDAPHAGQ